jgi:hypothetical protein
MDTPEPEQMSADLPLLRQMRAAEAAAKSLGAAGLFEEHRRLLSRINEHLQRSLIDPVVDIVRRSEAAMADLEPYAYRMGELGWTIPMFGPIPLARYIIENVPEDALDESFLFTYRKGWRKEERAMLRRLQSAEGLEPWRPLLSEATACYRHQHYLVAVPALLAIFEGAVAAAAHRERERKSPASIAETQREALDPGIVRLGWASLHGFIAAIFGHCSFAEGDPKLLNRHWVLHGRAAPRWGRIDCLRILQALDTLSIIARPCANLEQSDER